MASSQPEGGHRWQPVDDDRDDDGTDNNNPSEYKNINQTMTMRAPPLLAKAASPPSPATSRGSTETNASTTTSSIDDSSDDASYAHFSQWDITNATDFDEMLRNQTTKSSPLLPSVEPPPHWDVGMIGLFLGLAVLLCVGTVVRRARNSRRQLRAGYEPVHSLNV
jgi:hypothetical protein